MCVCVCVNQIKTDNNAVGELVLFFFVLFFVNLVMRWNGHVFFKFTE